MLRYYQNNSTPVTGFGKIHMLRIRRNIFYAFIFYAFGLNIFYASASALRRNADNFSNICVFFPTKSNVRQLWE